MMLVSDDMGLVFFDGAVIFTVNLNLLLWELTICNN